MLEVKVCDPKAESSITPVKCDINAIMRLVKPRLEAFRTTASLESAGLWLDRGKLTGLWNVTTPVKM